MAGSKDGRIDQMELVRSLVVEVPPSPVVAIAAALECLLRFEVWDDKWFCKIFVCCMQN